ncbi:hypothetical protein BC739_006531 [Kutzneria viridogrisea]|uniref:Uncharacterized protein n=1 Tax=Kutzneria viridogrisea TaxID=47990 RepID=A0ABR6BR09_9PSEU|nr:hypothetical protein [Kutzneria albida]MBA8929313.1 hypothetical protein [Kutzneria viridogrisea]
MVEQPGARDLPVGRNSAAVRRILDKLVVTGLAISPANDRATGLGRGNATILRLIMVASW